VLIYHIVWSWYIHISHSFWVLKVVVGMCVCGCEGVRVGVVVHHLPKPSGWVLILIAAFWGMKWRNLGHRFHAIRFGSYTYIYVYVHIFV